MHFLLLIYTSLHQDDELCIKHPRKITLMDFKSTIFSTQLVDEVDFVTPHNRLISSVYYKIGDYLIFFDLKEHSVDINLFPTSNEAEKACLNSNIKEITFASTIDLRDLSISKKEYKIPVLDFFNDIRGLTIKQCLNLLHANENRIELGENYEVIYKSDCMTYYFWAIDLTSNCKGSFQNMTSSEKINSILSSKIYGAHIIQKIHM